MRADTFKIVFSAPNRKIAFVHDSRADFRHAGPKRHCGNLLEGHRGLRMQVGPAQSRQSKISEFSARTKPAGFETEDACTRANTIFHGSPD